MEEEVELQDSIQPDESAELEETAVGDENIDVSELVSKNKQLYARNQKMKEELNSYKAQLNKSEKKDPAISLSDLSTREVLELRAQGYSETEILQLHEQASSFKVPITQLLKNDLVKEGIEAQRRKTKTEHAAPTPSSRSASLAFKGKPYGELKTDAERREAFNAMVAKGNSRSGSE